MGFLGNAFKHPGWYAGGILPGLAMNNFGQRESNPALPYKTGPASTAKDVKTDSALTKALGAIGDKQSGNIGTAYSTLRGNIDPNSDYATERFGKTRELAQGNLRANLEHVLGNEGYSDWKSQRDNSENMALAELTGELNRPSTLEEILGAINGTAGTGGQFYGLYNNVKKRPSKSGGTMASTNDFADTAFA